MDIRTLQTWFCIAVFNFSLMCGNCAEKDSSFFQLLDTIERTDGTIDHHQLWLQFGIKSHLFKDGYPEADIFTLNTGTNHWKLLRIYDKWPVECQYILFQLSTKGSWLFCGNIDFTGVHYEMPEHRLQEIGDRIWLVIKHIKGSGTGFLAQADAWYPLKESFGACELSYLHSGVFTDYTDKSEKMDEYTLINQECTVTKGKPVVELLHSITGSTTDEAGNKHILYKKDVRTRFVWSEEKMKFKVSEPVEDTIIVR